MFPKHKAPCDGHTETVKPCVGAKDNRERPESPSAKCCLNECQKMLIEGESAKNKRESKEFFYLELFLESVSLEPNVASHYECDYNVRSPMKATIQVGPMKLTPIENYQGSKVVLGEDKREQFEFRYDTGKTLLMSLPPSQYLFLLLSSPLVVSFEMQDSGLTPPVWFRLGRSQSVLPRELARRCLLGPNVEASHQVRIECPVMSRDGVDIGIMHMAVSLSCMGDVVVTEIQQLEPATFVHSNQSARKMGKPKLRGKKQVALLRNTYEAYVKERSFHRFKIGDEMRQKVISRILEAKSVQGFVRSRQGQMVRPRHQKRELINKIVESMKKEKMLPM